MGTDFGTGEDGVPDLDEDLEEECNPKALKASDKKNAVKEGIDHKGEFSENLEEGDQFMAVKPWMGVIKNSVPTGYKPNKRDGEAPDAELALEYVYGYRCHDARNNLRYTADDKLVYHCAGVGVVMDKRLNTQKFFMDHRDDIHCLAIHPNGRICATGQIGPKPRLCVWDNQTMECLAMFTTPLTKGIKTVAFSNDGKYLVASAMDDDH